MFTDGISEHSEHNFNHDLGIIKSGELRIYLLVIGFKLKCKCDEEKIQDCTKIYFIMFK